MSTEVSGIPIKENFYNQVFPGLQKKTEERGCRFYSRGTPRTLMSELLDELSVQPRVRSPFGIENDHSVLVGIIVIPKPERKHFGRAWNRFEPPMREKLKRAEQQGFKGKPLSFVVIQVWERERSCVLIPYKDLVSIPKFRETGNFTVLKDDGGGGYFLQKPRHEPKIRLKEHLEQIFDFLSP